MKKLHSPAITRNDHIEPSSSTNAVSALFNFLGAMGFTIFLIVLLSIIQSIG